MYATKACTLNNEVLYTCSKTQLVDYLNFKYNGSVDIIKEIKFHWVKCVLCLTRMVLLSAIINRKLTKHKNYKMELTKQKL